VEPVQQHGGFVVSPFRLPFDKTKHTLDGQSGGNLEGFAVKILLGGSFEDL